MQNHEETVAAAEPGSWRELLRIAWPLMISSGSLSLMLVVDRTFLAWYSQNALAAALPSGFLFWTLISIPLGAAQYVTAFVAQYEGARRPDRLVASVWQGVYFSLLATLLLMLVAPASDVFFTWMRHAPEIRGLESEYFAMLCWSGGPIILTAALSSYYSGRGRTRVVMWVNIGASLINAALDPVLIFGGLGVTAMGIRGAALATGLANLLAALTFAALILRESSRSGNSVLIHSRFDTELFGRLLRFGLPQGFHMFFDLICFTMFVYLVGVLGTQQLAATNMAFTMNALAFVPLLGIGTAVTTLVGMRIGEGRPALASRTTWLAFGMSGLYMSLFVAVYVLAPDAILLPFRWRMESTEYLELRRHVVVLLRFVAVYSLFDAMAVVFGSAIRGAGDTRFAMAYSLTMGLLVMIVPTYLWQTYFQGGLLAAWTAATAFIVALGLGFLARFQGGRWQLMKVIEERAGT
jgi:multidrug resistance protein, MATE family